MTEAETENATLTLTLPKGCKLRKRCSECVENNRICAIHQSGFWMCLEPSFETDKDGDTVIFTIRPCKYDKKGGLEIRE
jgi:hypothetical protein